MKHTFVAPIQVRAEKGEKDVEYVVKGRIKANIPDHYGSVRTPYGKKPLRSVFSDNCIASMERQAKAKKIYVDSNHKIAAQMNIEGYLDSLGVSKDDKEKILNEVKVSSIPFAKLISLSKGEDGSELVVDTRLNPHFRIASKDHESYFDAVWKSMQDEYINGISFDFSPIKVLHKDGVDLIDDVVLFGINYVGGQALPENNIFEVAMRATKDFVEQEGGRMEDVEKRMKELEAREKAFAEKEAEVRRAEEAKKDEALKKEIDSHKDTIELMKKQLEELKAKSVPESGRKSTVRSDNPYNHSVNETVENDKFRSDFGKMLREKARVTNPFPNRENLWNGRAQETNPHGEFTLGHALYLHREVFDKQAELMDPYQRSAVFSDSSPMAHITRPKRVI